MSLRKISTLTLKSNRHLSNWSNSSKS